MLWFEREVVGALIRSEDRAVRSPVEAFVDESLRDKPEHLRLGLVGESIVLGGYAGALRALGRLDGDHPLRELLDSWETGPDRARLGAPALQRLGRHRVVPMVPGPLRRARGDRPLPPPIAGQAGPAGDPQALAVSHIPVPEVPPVPREWVRSHAGPIR